MISKTGMRKIIFLVEFFWRVEGVLRLYKTVNLTSFKPVSFLKKIVKRRDEKILKQKRDALILGILFKTGDH